MHYGFTLKLYSLRNIPQTTVKMMGYDTHNTRSCIVLYFGNITGDVMSRSKICQNWPPFKFRLKTKRAQHITRVE